MYWMFGSEFGWGPDQVRILTLEQANGYFRQIEKYREHIGRGDQTLVELKELLLAWFGVKQEPADEEKRHKEMDASPLLRTTITEEEKQAWIKADMPPIQTFLKGYRNGH